VTGEGDKVVFSIPGDTKSDSSEWGMTSLEKRMILGDGATYFKQQTTSSVNEKR
jgi:hypothetical protein